jgi:hypothetical protein
MQVLKRNRRPDSARANTAMDSKFEFQAFQDFGVRAPDDFNLEIRFVVEREFKKAVAAVEIQFAANIEPMVFDGLDTDSQQVGDFLAGAIFGDEFQNPAFGRGEVINLRFAQEQFLHAVAAPLDHDGHG